MSVVLDFSALLSDVAPVSPMSLSVIVKKKEKSGLLMDIFGVYSFVFTPQIEFCECCV